MLYRFFCLALCLGASNTRIVPKTWWTSVARITGSTISAGFLLSHTATASVVLAPWDANVRLEVIHSAATASPTPKPGDLVAVRFKGAYKGVEFDNTFNPEEPFYYRVGVGSVLRGIDDAVLHMRVGDRYHLSFGGELAFGEKGRPSAPGKPRIPPNADVDYEVELVSIPGAEQEIISDE